MMGQIQQVNIVQQIVESGLYSSMPDDERNIMSMWLDRSAKIWFGVIKNEIVCCWGVVVPTLLSDKAYLWLKTSEKVNENKFLFVRYSQRALEEVFNNYACIIGHTKATEARSIRWLKWLGAEFSEGENGMLSFEIRKKSWPIQ